MKALILIIGDDPVLDADPRRASAGLADNHSELTGRRRSHAVADPMTS